MNTEKNPIRLSVELLELAGFHMYAYGDGVYAKHPKMPFLFIYDDGKEDNEFYLRQEDDIGPEIRYFHELKKAYFDHTGDILMVTL